MDVDHVYVVQTVPYYLFLISMVANVTCEIIMKADAFVKGECLETLW